MINNEALIEAFAFNKKKKKILFLKAIESYIISHFLLIIYSLIELTGSRLLVHHTHKSLSDSKSCRPVQTHINGTSTSILLKLLCIFLIFKPVEHSSISESKLANSHIVFTLKNEKRKKDIIYLKSSEHTTSTWIMRNQNIGSLR